MILMLSILGKIRHTWDICRILKQISIPSVTNYYLAVSIVLFTKLSGNK